MKKNNISNTHIIDKIIIFGGIMFILFLIIGVVLLFARTAPSMKKQVENKTESVIKKDFNLKQIKLENVSELHGSGGMFLLVGGGSIRSGMQSYYYFYWEVEDGVFQFDRIPTKYARIIEDGVDRQYMELDSNIVEKMELYSENTIEASVNYPTLKRQVVMFHVPPNSITDVIEINEPLRN